MRTDHLEDCQSLINHFNAGLDHLQQFPELLHKAVQFRNSLNNLVRVEDNYYPRAWVEPYAVRLGKPLDQITLDSIAELINPEASKSFFPAGLTYTDLDRWRKQHGQQHRIFTGTVDYSATGEGLTLIFAAAQAYTMGDFLLWLAGQIGYYYAIGADVYDGLPDPNNMVAKYLMTRNVQKRLEGEINAEQPGHVEILFRSHVNYS